MSKKSYFRTVLAVIFVACSILAFPNLINSQSSGYIPEEGFVPNAETATKIAEAIWLPIYGKKIYSERPFVAKLNKEGNWVVQGTLRKGYVGGTAYAEIRKRDCMIIKVTHYK